MLRRTLPALLAVCMLSTSAFAADFSTPKEAFKTFFTAVREGDKDTAMKAVVDDAEQKQFAGMMFDFASPFMQLDVAMKDKFGEGFQMPGQQPMPTPEMIEKAEVTVDGETAKVLTTGQTEPAILKNVGGEWKIDFSEQIEPGMMEQMEMGKKILGVLTPIAKSHTQEVKDGKYETAEAANTAFMTKLQQAMMQQQQQQQGGGGAPMGGNRNDGGGF